MKFKLCYKEYEYKITNAAKREFKRETGRGLWSTLQGVFNIVNTNKGKDEMVMCEEVGKHVDDVDGAILLYTLAKQCNSTLKLDEIADGCDRVGWRSYGSADEWAQAYTYILYTMVLDVDQWYEEEAIKAKKASCHSEAEQD